jgi:molybdate transport system substrate-binding protein
MAALFEEQHRVSIVLNFAASSTLSTQIIEGAPADIFASADAKQMQLIVEAGLIEDGPNIFARNTLVVITPDDAPLSSLEGLASEGIRLVLAGPEVPVGNYARQVLENLNTSYGADFSARVLANLASEEPNVRQVAAKVELGEADAAIVYLTDARLLSNIKTLAIPEVANVIASYPIATLGTSPQAELAQVFVAFVLSREAQAILNKYGFKSPD